MTLESRFWAKVDRRDPDQCWPWTGATNEHGYGVMRPEGQRHGPTIKAHRVSAELAGMDIAGRFVLHSCDNRPCVNPAHLHAGSAAENSAEMANRDRSVHGSKNTNARLTEVTAAEVKSLLAEGHQHKVIAAAYGVNRSTVGMIAIGKTWRRIETPAVTPPAARDLIAAVVESLA